MNLTESLKNKINNLYNNTSENIHSVGLGYKIINNERTNIIGIVFKVFKKKSLLELNESEILPSSIEIDNKSYVTDVIEETSIPSALSCYSRGEFLNDPDPEILRLRGYPSFLYPIKGGQEISNFPQDWTRDGASIYRYVGTLGILAIDNYDNNIVGITNAHVACSNPFIASDRTSITEELNPYNIVEPAPFILDDSQYRPGTLSLDWSFALASWSERPLLISAPRVKRYQSLNKINNTVDCALLFLNNSLVTENSFGIHAPSTEPVSSLKPPFATTEELDNLLSLQPFLFSTGRTTGPKGWSDTPSCRLIPTGIGLTSSVDFGDDNIFTFSNVIQYQYEDGGMDSAAGGDSGSAVLADINGTIKIIGLVFAGGQSLFGVRGDRTLVCRIDEIAQALNIRAWESDYVYNAVAPCGNPYTDTAEPVPENPTLSKIVVCESDDPKSSWDSISIDGVKYYQAGCTYSDVYYNMTLNNTTPDPTPTPTPTLTPTPTPTPTPTIPNGVNTIFYGCNFIDLNVSFDGTGAPINFTFTYAGYSGHPLNPGNHVWVDNVMGAYIIYNQSDELWKMAIQEIITYYSTQLFGQWMVYANDLVPGLNQGDLSSGFISNSPC